MASSNVDCEAAMSMMGAGCCVNRSLKEAETLRTTLPFGSHEQVVALQAELAKTKDEHQASLSKVTRSLSGLTNKLMGAESRWAPWDEVNTLKQEVAEMRGALEHQIIDAKQQQERVEVQEPSSPQARALQGLVAKSHVQRRKSLTDVTQGLAEIDSKLQTAETSWDVWAEVNDAKQQVADVQNIVDQHIGDFKHHICPVDAARFYQPQNRGDVKQRPQGSTQVEDKVLGA